MEWACPEWLAFSCSRCSYSEVCAQPALQPSTAMCEVFHPLSRWGIECSVPVPPRKSPEEASTFSDFCQVGFCPRALGMQTGIWWPVCGWPLDTSHLDGQMANVPWSPADWPKAPVQTLPKPTKINIMTGSISLGRKKNKGERCHFWFPKLCVDGRVKPFSSYVTWIWIGSLFNFYFYVKTYNALKT